MSGAVTILGLDGDSQNVLSRIFKQPYFFRELRLYYIRLPAFFGFAGLQFFKSVR